LEGCLVASHGNRDYIWHLFYKLEDLKPLLK